MVFKIITSIQKDTSKTSHYWEILKISNNQDKWDAINQNEVNTLKPFGDIVKEALSKSDTTMKTKMEL